MEENSIHQFGMAWKANDPPKIQIFAWTVALEIIIERRFRGEIPRCVFPFMACLSTKNKETRNQKPSFLFILTLHPLYGLDYVEQLIFFGQLQSLVRHY